VNVNPKELEAAILEQLHANPGRDHTPEEYVVVKNQQLVVSEAMAQGALEALVARGEAARRTWGSTTVYGVPEAPTAA
jgi:hypothetical protein